jgi:serine/threonine protein kinase/pimeloyl-ACP methyl ester carboxylesterase
MNTGNDPPADGALNDAAPPPKAAPTMLVSAAPSEQPGDRIGRYKLLQLIGEGGCGAVYMAEQQEPVRRRVALKVIKLGMDTKQVIARFEAERQALAMMDHSNIAKVLDAGATENGRPYFVMELVRGIKITEYCDQNHLDTEQRLGLFVQVCQAIQHAHQKGIIHRDIKPSNILVTMHDGVPVPKVIDFGIAKATTNQLLTDKTLFTAYEQFIGTPAYMSPEQAEMSGLDIDTRSDVYSLGVLLYELLTGRTPFDPRELMKSGLDAMRKTIREEEPPRPSTKLDTLQGEDSTTTARAHGTEMPKLISLLRGDLDWIVMKCLEKDRTRRYESVNGLTMDIQRHVSNEPVIARPPSKLYRFQKMVQRNKPTFIAAAAILATLCVGLGVSTWLFLREREAHRQAVALLHVREEADRLQQREQNRKKLTEAIAILHREQGPELKHGDEVERLIADIPISEIPDEDIQLVAYLGTWHARHGRWKQASERFTSMLSVARRPDVAANARSSVGLATAYLWNAITLLHAGETAAYDDLRQKVLSNYAGTSNWLVLGTIVKLVLLKPADGGVLSALRPLAELYMAEVKGHATKDDLSWHETNLALWEYRRGNYGAVEPWCQRSIALEPEDSRIAQAQLLLAMAHLQLGSTNLAQSELEQPRDSIQSGFDEGLRTSRNYWHEWIIDRLLLREAESLFAARGVPASASSPAQNQAAGATSSTNVVDLFIRFSATDGTPLEGKLSLPAGAKGQVPVVFYLHGSGPRTVDNPIQDAGGRVVYRYLDFFSHELARRGVAFFRISKRGCTSDPSGRPTTDRSVFSKATPSVLLDDYAKALEVLRQRSEIDANRIVVFGSSEGTRLAPKLTTRSPKGIVGLVLKSYVSVNLRETIVWQLTVGPWRNIQKLIPAAADGKLTRADYDAAVKNNPWLAKVLNFGSLDTDGDGIVTPEELSRGNLRPLEDILKAVDERNDADLRQALNLSSAYLLEDWNGPPTHVTLLKLDIPIAIFHGELDGTVSIEGVREAEAAFRAAGKTNLVVRTYPYHDHDLNWTIPAASRGGPTPFREAFDFVARLVGSR